MEMELEMDKELLSDNQEFVKENKDIDFLKEIEILNKISQTQSVSVEQKFDHNDWQDTEKKASHLEQTVINCLINLGLNNGVESDFDTLPIAGEDVYINTRRNLSKWNDTSLLYEDYVISKYIKFMKSKTSSLAEVKKMLEMLVNLNNTFDTVLDKIYKLKLLDESKKYLQKYNKSEGYMDCVNLIEQLDNTSSNIKKNKKEKKTKIKKQIESFNKKDKIRFENLVRIYTEKMDILLNTFKMDNLNTSYGFGQVKIIELVGITFMYMVWYVLHHLEEYTKKSKLVDVYEIIVAIQKFIHSCDTYLGHSLFNSANKQSVSTTMLIDLKFWVNELINQFDFDGLKIYDIAPKLIIYTNYDSSIPQKSIKPKKNQSDLINIVRDNITNHSNDGLLVILKAPISSGKTFSAIALVNLIKSLRTNSKLQPELIFCCNLRSVKNQIANLAYNAKIKFGIGYIRNDNVRIVNHYTCKISSERELIICSPNVAELLLKQNKDKYWLFLDEPTVGADRMGDDSLNKNVSVLMNMPKYTILSSATMPNFEDLQPMVDLHKAKYPNVHLKTVYSGEIQIGCDVKLHNSDMILPHLTCKNKMDLVNVIKRIETNPFLGRMYTYKVVRQLCKDLCAFPEIVLPDLKNMFKDVNNLSSDKIRIVAMDLLKSMCNLNDSDIERLCSVNFADNLKQYDVLVNDGNDVSDFDNPNSNLKYDCLGTSQSYRFQGMNLVVSSNPINFAMVNFKPLLNKLTEKGYASAQKIIEKYNKEMTVYNKLCSKIKDNSIKQEKTSKGSKNYTLTNDNNRDIEDKVRSSRVNLDEKTSTQMDACRPSIDFPVWAQINTLQHIGLFAKPYLKLIDPRLIRKPFMMEDLPLDVNIPDEIMLLLMCGIGIYAPSDNTLDYKYTRFVMDMALNGRLAYLIADNSISYGTNYPIVRLFVTDDFAEYHSVYTLLQLMGRPGRVGHSYKAEVFLEQFAANLLLKFSHDVDNLLGRVEADNINRTIENINRKIELEKQHILEKERIEKERLENERLEKERLENERLEKERLEKERLEKERLEKERLEKERLEKERLEKEKRRLELIEQNKPKSIYIPPHKRTFKTENINSKWRKF